jgi:hypothetical protein
MIKKVDYLAMNNYPFERRDVVPAPTQVNGPRATEDAPGERL